MAYMFGIWQKMSNALHNGIVGGSDVIVLTEVCMKATHNAMESEL